MGEFPVRNAIENQGTLLTWVNPCFDSFCSNYSLSKAQLNLNYSEMEISKTSLFSFLVVCTICLFNLNKRESFPGPGLHT